MSIREARNSPPRCFCRVLSARVRRRRLLVVEAIVNLSAVPSGSVAYCRSNLISTSLGFLSSAYLFGGGLEQLSVLMPEDVDAGEFRTTVTHGFLLRRRRPSRAVDRIAVQTEVPARAGSIAPLGPTAHRRRHLRVLAFIEWRSRCRRPTPAPAWPPLKSRSRPPVVVECRASPRLGILP